MKMRLTSRPALMLLSLAGTFIVLRLSLAVSPDADLDIAGYNIHHLYAGVLLLALCGLPLIHSPGNGWPLKIAALGFGAGLSMALDEVIYLIVTDGSNHAYLLPVSFWSGFILIALTCLYILFLAHKTGPASERPAHTPDEQDAAA